MLKKDMERPYFIFRGVYETIQYRMNCIYFGNHVMWMPNTDGKSIRNGRADTHSLLFLKLVTVDRKDH